MLLYWYFITPLIGYEMSLDVTDLSLLQCCEHGSDETRTVWLGGQTERRGWTTGTECFQICPTLVLLLVGFVCLSGLWVVLPFVVGGWVGETVGSVRVFVLLRNLAPSGDAKVYVGSGPELFFLGGGGVSQAPAECTRGSCPWERPGPALALMWRGSRAPPEAWLHPHPGLLLPGSTQLLSRTVPSVLQPLMAVNLTHISISYAQPLGLRVVLAVFVYH